MNAGTLADVRGFARARPSKWPAGVSADQALGYLLARQVPADLLPEALTWVRVAAGWELCGDVDGSSGSARLWLRAAREHARALGPPPGLDCLLAVLADGRIRTRLGSALALAAAGAGELADPVILMDFARWCGSPGIPRVVIRTDVHEQSAVIRCLYGADASRLRALRSRAGRILRRASVMRAADLKEKLAASGFTVDVGEEPAGLMWILDVDGQGAWVWPSPAYRTPLTRTMERLEACGRAVSINEIPAAVSRASSSYPQNGQPVPVGGVRAWVQHSQRWALTQDSYAEPAQPRAGLARARRADQLVLSVCAAGGETLTWHELRDGLAGLGASDSFVAYIIRCSPLLHRSTEGYQLAGRSLRALP